MKAVFAQKRAQILVRACYQEATEVLKISRAAGTCSWEAEEAALAHLAFPRPQPSPRSAPTTSSQER